MDQPVTAFDAGWIIRGWAYLLIVVPGSVCAAATAQAAATVVEVETDEFNEVSLTWGVNGWRMPPREHWPTGTVEYRKIVRTPMAAGGGRFRVQLDLPPGTTLDCGLLFMRNRHGRVIEPFWYGLPRMRAGETVRVGGGGKRFDAGEDRPLWLLVLMGGAMLLPLAATAMVLGWLAHCSGDRTVWVLVAIITLAGLGLRLAAAWHWNTVLPDSPGRLVGDEPSYDDTARQLLRGDGYTWAGRVPGYPAFLAGVYWFSGGSYRAVPYVQALLGACAVPFTFLLGRRLLGTATGVMAATLAAASPVLVKQCQRLMSEPVYVPLMLAAVILLARAWQHPSWRRWLAAGAVLGMANLVRPSLLLLPLFVLLTLLLTTPWRRAIGSCTVYAAAAFATVAPWVLYNYVTHHAIFPLQTSNAILWQGSPEYYHLLHREHYTYMEVWTQVLYGPGWQEHDPTSVAGDRWWTQRAIRSIQAEPDVYARYFVEKLATLWVGDPNADWGDTHVFNYTWLRRSMGGHWAAVAIMLLRLLPIAALVAAAALRRHLRALMPVYAVLAYITLLHAATHAEVRLSEPFQPLLLVLVCGAPAMFLLARRRADDTVAPPA